MQSKVDGLFSQDPSIRLDNVRCVGVLHVHVNTCMIVHPRRIKHLVIGNRTKKCSFMILGVVPR